MGRNCYKNNELNGVFLSILNGVAVHPINFVSTRGGGVMHLVNFPMSFLNPYIIWTNRIFFKNCKKIEMHSFIT